MTKVCWYCLKEAEPPFRKGKRRCVCNECRKKQNTIEAEEKKAYVLLKKREMLRNALCKLEEQGMDMYKYRAAIQKVMDYVETHPDKFDSSYEMMAAIVLIYHGVRCSFQYKVLRFQCDICIPDWKIIIEIDGERHTRTRREEENIRDKKILAELGEEEWNIIRIRTDLLDMKAENLLKAIKGVMELRIKQGRAER